MKVTFWGTRGSLSMAGLKTNRYGGNTACVEVRGSRGSILVLDAGTGIRALGTSLGQSISRVDILLSHLHLDHIQGLGFFAPMYDPSAEVHIWGPASTTLDLRTRLSRYLSPPLFPVRIRDFPCQLFLHDVPFEPFAIGEFEIWADAICHPGATVGYRIAEGDATVAYLSDHEPALGVRDFPEAAEWTSGYNLAKGVDLLIHDGQYVDGEYGEHVGWGHSSMAQALAFAGLTGVKCLALFHHDPSHDDWALEKGLQQARGGRSFPFELLIGEEGRSFDLA